MRQILGYMVMLLRAYRRDWVALFFGFFFPLIFMGLFGILNFGSFGHVSLGIVDNANNAEMMKSLVLKIDKTAPTVTINQGVGQADPTATVPVHFTVVFSEPVTNLLAANVTLGGTATTRSVSAVTDSGDHTTFDVAATAVGNGTITASLAAKVKSPVSTPLTLSLKVTVNRTLVALVGLPPALTIEETVGAVLSRV